MLPWPRRSVLKRAAGGLAGRQRITFGQALLVVSSWPEALHQPTARTRWSSATRSNRIVNSRVDVPLTWLGRAPSIELKMRRERISRSCWNQRPTRLSTSGVKIAAMTASTPTNGMVKRRNRVIYDRTLSIRRFEPAQDAGLSWRPIFSLSVPRSAFVGKPEPWLCVSDRGPRVPTPCRTLRIITRSSSMGFGVRSWRAGSRRDFHAPRAASMMANSPNAQVADRTRRSSLASEVRSSSS